MIILLETVLLLEPSGCTMCIYPLLFIIVSVLLLKMTQAAKAIFVFPQVAVDGPGLYTGPVFTAASTGPLFST